MERLFSSGRRFISMAPDVFLDQYRISTADDGTSQEISRNGPAVTYKASDLKSGAPVALTVVPMASVDPSERQRFEEKARTAMLLDHLNIARTVAFGVTDDSFVFVSEYPVGETVQEWVTANGPMPADAVLRIGLQVVAALAAASFHGLTHPAIQPANLVIVTGKTAEGGWPFVKLIHFALCGLKSAPGHTEPDVSASDFASPEQLLQGKVDFRSEIYSLGATMCFLLTGVFYSAYPRSPQTKRFARPLRTLISRTLEDDPEQRPQDPVLFTEELRTCLVAIDRRQTLRRRFGIPFAPAVAKPPRKRRVRQSRRPTPLLAAIGPTAVTAEPERRPSRLRPALAIIGCLLALGVAAALFLPEDVVTAALHRHKSKQSIGVPVGVPESSPAALVQSATPVSAAPASGPGSTEVVSAKNSAPAAQARVNPPISSAIPQTPAAAQSAAPAPAVIAQQDSVPPGGQGTNAEKPSTNTGAGSSRNSSRESTPATIANVDGTGPTVANQQQQAAIAQSAPASQQQAAATPEATPAVVASNNVAPEPAPPSEGSEADVGTAQSAQAEPDESETAAAAEDKDASSSEEQSSHKKPSATRNSRMPKMHGKKSTVAQSRGRSYRSRVPRALPAEPDEPAGRGDGSIRARVVGITPNGNVILAMPSGERAIVSPHDADHYSPGEATHRRPRRVIIERRTILVPQVPPYQPFMPPDA